MQKCVLWRLASQLAGSERIDGKGVVEGTGRFLGYPRFESIPPETRMWPVYGPRFRNRWFRLKN